MELYNYDLFEVQCAQYGYTYEPFVYKTPDHWNLTVFHITGYRNDEDAQAARDALTADKYPVLAIPGSFSDAQTWFRDANGGKPMHLQLYDQGYDIWMGNNRGTKYSNINDNWPVDDDSFEHWNFSWAELGLYDDPVTIDFIMEQTGQAKVNYIGYSMGTTQMFYGLTHLESYYHSRFVNKFIALAPCIYFETTTWDEYADGYGEYRKLGVNVIGGPNWQTHVDDICANMSESWCNSAKGNFNMEPQPLKSREWYYQITVSDRYQTYDPFYAYQEKDDMPLISPGLDAISKVPIHFLVGSDDTHCSLDHAKRIQSEINGAVKSIDVMEGFEHGTFGGATNKEFVDTILARLAEDETQTAPEVFLQ